MRDPQDNNRTKKELKFKTNPFAKKYKANLESRAEALKNKMK